MSERDTELFELALDLLDGPARETLESEIDGSPELRRTFAEIRDVVSAMALAEEPVAPTPALRERLLASTREETRFDGFVQRLTGMLELGSARVRALLADVATAPGAPWVPGVADGNELRHFDAGPSLAEAHCGLVRLEPGLGFPRHEHQGLEHTFVLAGAMEDAGQILLPGDELVLESDSVHDFRSVGEEALVFVVVLHTGLALVQE